MNKYFTIKSIATLIILLASFCLFAQDKQLSTDSRRAIKHYEEAINAYDRYDYDEAEASLNKAIKIDFNFIEAHLFLSQVYRVTNKTEKAIIAAENAIQINPDFFPSIYFNLGSMLFYNGEYEKSLQYFSTFLNYQNIRSEARDISELRKASCEFAIEAIENPVPFDLVNLGENVNSDFDEYWPSLSADEKTLVITRNIPKDESVHEVMYNRQEDFYISTREPDGEWQPARNIGAPINTPRFNEGAQSLTADGQRMYYTVCKGNCNLFVSDKDENGNWGRPRPLPEPVNLPNTSEKQPSISPDGKTLYFVSNREDGYGKFDIWRSVINENGNWSEPENIGDSINTAFNEQSPFIHFDNQTLYFSSSGHVGMGGLDIYKTTMLNDSTWSTPINLGYPINTYRDEDGLIVNAKGTSAYFSSDVDAESGRDIYKFDLPEEVRPTPASYIEGSITDASNGWPVNANVSLIDISTDKEFIKKDDLVDGRFLITLPTNRNYAFFVSKPNYLFYSKNFNLKGTFTADKPFRLNIELKPITVGETMVMRNVFFETDSYELKDESLTELNKLIDLLKLNPKMEIEVGGHTDNVGSAEYNKTLSDNRAKSVANYLTNNGIDSERITWKGYGLTKPIGDNSTEEGRAENRRTEIRVIGM
ncbi:MAG: OmpA family protein [Bacteroidales bacterium]